VHYAAEALTDAGMRRLSNEDAFLIDEERELLAVADGMGGMENGGVASSLASKMLPDLLRRNNFEPYESPVDD